MKHATLWLCMLFVLLSGCTAYKSGFTHEIYFLDNNNQITGQSVKIGLLSGEKTHEALLRKAFNDPAGKFNTPYPGLRYVSSQRKGSLLIIELISDSYRASYDAAYTAGCLTLTVYGVEGITNVSIRIDQKPLVIGGKTEFTPSDFIIDDLFTVTDTVKIDLFLPKEDFNDLTMVTNEITLYRNESLEMKIIEELARGIQYEKAVLSTVPENVLISAVTFERTCYVNFKFLYYLYLDNYSTQIHDMRMSVFSVVNSLCRLPGISQVQFLIDGEIPSIVYGDIDMSRALRPIASVREAE